jgi:hypothetical protein
MLLDTEHHAWLESNWSGEPSRREKNRLIKGLCKQFKLSSLEATEAVQVFLKDPAQSELDVDVVAILKEESNKRQSRVCQMKWTIAIFGTFLVAWAIFCIATGRDLEIVSYGGVFASFGAAMAVSGRHKLAARAAAKLKDKRAFGPLVELLFSEDKAIKEIAADAVQGLLPLLEREDFDKLEPARRGQLLNALAATKNIDFAAAILGAAGRHGDAQYIAPVESFAEGKSKLSKKDHPRGQSLARMSLADIRMRVAKEKIDARLQEFGGSLTEYTTQVLDNDGEGVTVQA